jgi:uncharacterized protein (TIGR02271 family)
MTQINAQSYEAWIGCTVVDQSGTKVGKVEQIYLDDQSGRPEWLTVKTGMFGGSSSFVPLTGAAPLGDNLVVRYSKDMIKGAPRVDAGGHLSPDQEAALYRYYGRQYGSEPSDRQAPPGERGGEGYDTSGPTTDDAMTRSEEELRVGKTQQESGRARLRKHVVTEQVQTTVPVSHEEVRIEREPITEDNVDRATDGPAISEEEHEMILHEEQPVVEKRVVAKERVRLTTDTVTNDAQVSEEVRKERIDAEDSTKG